MAAPAVGSGFREQLASIAMMNVVMIRRMEVGANVQALARGGAECNRTLKANLLALAHFLPAKRLAGSVTVRSPKGLTPNTARRPTALPAAPLFGLLLLSRELFILINRYGLASSLTVGDIAFDGMGSFLSIELQ